MKDHSNISNRHVIWVNLCTASLVPNPNFQETEARDLPRMLGSPILLITLSRNRMLLKPKLVNTTVA